MIVDADEIIVLNESAIVKRDSHDALLASNDIYADLWQTQCRPPDALNDRPRILGS